MSKQSMITSIQKQKSRKRYNIFINEDFAFSVHEDILIKYQLTKGKNLEQVEWVEILHADEKNRIRHYAYSYLSHSPRTAKELLNYLVNKGFTEKDCLDIVGDCKKEGYINDESYSEQWIESRKRSRPRGKNLIKMELMNKGIEESIVEQQIKKAVSGEDEEEMIHSLIEKKLKCAKFENSYELKKKLIPYLQRKGFSFEQILRVINTIKDQYLL
ncbi:MAG TPA: RecX family transcriptional regulator [Bacillota bacterium]|nr:RecX family transcriptional regulator [Bacillota bacterium]